MALDLADGMLQTGGRRQTLLRRFRARLCRCRLPAVADGERRTSCFSNLMLQWCNDPDRCLRECRRVLRPGGLLSFATFGPDTLVELRRAWAAVDGHVHVNRFIDMHDLGDALVRAGLAEPVMDVERYTLTYADVRDLMRRPEGHRRAQRNARAGRGA